MMAMVGGKDKTRIRNATPPEFRDLLIDIARSVTPSRTTHDHQHQCRQRGGRAT